MCVDERSATVELSRRLARKTPLGVTPFTPCVDVSYSTSIMAWDHDQLAVVTGFGSHVASQRGSHGVTQSVGTITTPAPSPHTCTSTGGRATRRSRGAAAATPSTTTTHNHRHASLSTRQRSVVVVVWALVAAGTEAQGRCFFTALHWGETLGGVAAHTPPWLRSGVDQCVSDSQ